MARESACYEDGNRAESPGPGASSADRMQALVSAVTSLAENLSLEAVLDRLVVSACQLVGARYGAFGVIGDDEALTHFVTAGIEGSVAQRVNSLPPGRGMVGHLVRDPRPLRLKSLQNRPRANGFSPGDPPMRTFLGVPVRIRDVVFGNLYLTEKHSGGLFTVEDEELTVALAAASGVAIENARLFEQSTRRQQWLEAGMTVSEQLMGNVHGEAAGLSLIAEGALQQSESLLAVIAIPDAMGRAMRLSAVTGAVDLLRSPSLPARGSAVEYVRDNGGSVLCGARELFGAAADSQLGPALVTVLGHRGTHAGVLILVRGSGGRAYSQVDVEMHEMYCSRAALALELANFHLLREQQLVLTDRDRIARDLHDLVIQRIFAVGLSIQSLRRFATAPVAQQRIKTVTEELDETIRELRDTIYALRATGSREPLSARIVRAVQDGAWQTGTTPEVQLRGPVDIAISDEVAEHLIAVISEGLSNALRHSHASEIILTVNAADGLADLTIEDNGRGFSAPSRLSGLENLEHRAVMLGGTFRVTSAPGEGTRLRWTVPQG